MPAKNRIKKYKEGGYYHIYNRGVDRREIFRDEQDYKTFLFTLKRYLEPYLGEVREGFKKDRPSILTHKQRMSLDGEVDLLAYCLMPNHFHLLVKQRSKNGITKLVRRVCTNYSMYFNRKHGRKGVLFEGIYKAVMVTGEKQLINLSCYIHLNPVNVVKKRYGLIETVVGSKAEEYLYSSYRKYLGLEQAAWVKPEGILGMIHGTSYREFVQSSGEDLTGDEAADDGEKYN